MKIIESFHDALKQGITADIFNNLRNLVTCTLILAAAMTAPMHHQSVTLFGSLSWYMGSLIALVAILLAALNLYDGAYRIIRRGKHGSVVILFVVVYVAISIRIGQLVWELRYLRF
ncbi:hypothetical protein [Dokdonella sp.]|uniref:hypothetical protein n=1 Tax=Dokdonella sp. TaxID=2291710 RepID=UPI003C5CE23F